MTLKEYRRKRSFDRSPEPVGTASGSDNQWRFVIQKHAARSPHYDLRLELDGVLKSWAVPKGPSLDPTQKRLAIHVEDHPLEYLQFEGVIPAGEYGGGIVMVWDTGQWQPVESDGYPRGELKFDLDGHKLQGRWMLVHSGRRTGDSQHWLLFKERDAAARTERELNILTEFPHSVLSHRSLEQIAADRDAVWTASADLPCTPSSPAVLSTHPTSHGSRPQKSPRLAPGRLPGARKARLPASPRPALPSPVRTPPRGSQWLHEIKYDGYRMLCRIAKGEAHFLSRNGHDWTDRLPTLAHQAVQLPVREAVLDGEVVAMSADGTSDFQALQNTISRGQDRFLRYYVFDLLHLNGYDLRSVSFEQRKEMLSTVVVGRQDAILFSEHLEADGQIVFQQACKLGAEGIVSKRRGSKYVAGRSADWVKTKSVQSSEMIVGGYTDSTAPRQAFGALLVGRWDDQRQLQYAGRVGTGFREETMEQLAEAFRKLPADASPFSILPPSAGKRNVHHVRPELVVEVEFRGWTKDHKLRFPSFRGWRDDVTASDIPAEAVVADNARPPTASQAKLGDVNAVKLTNPDRVMYPQQGISKLGVATYYAQVFPWMLPHLVDRPLSLVRCPQGCDSKCFFQKHAPAGLPDAVRRRKIDRGDNGCDHVLIVRDVAGLLALVQFSVLEVHIWAARVDRPDRPDRLVFDLDPDPDLPFARVVNGALELKVLLGELGLTSFVNTSGGKGLHVVVPLRRSLGWDRLAEFARGVATLMATAAPGRYTTSPSKPARSGKIYVDYQRNRWGATAVAPYSTRARATAAVAVPVAWDELQTISSAQAFTLSNVWRRLANQQRDPWAELCTTRQTITHRMMRTVHACVPTSTAKRRGR